MKQGFTSFWVFSAIMLTSTANAEINGFGDREGFTAGIGVIADWAPYDGADTPSTTPVPYLAYDWENAHLGVDGFDYSFFKTDQVTLTASIVPRWSFGDPEDSPLFEDIERDTALEAGLGAEISLGHFFVGGSFRQDISNVHTGYEGASEIGIEAEFGKFEVETTIGYVYRDKHLSAHLYGVGSDEARAGLSAYAPNAAWYPNIRAELLYPIGRSMGVLAFAEYEQLGSDAKNSPLVSGDDDTTVGLVFLKRF